VICFAIDSKDSLDNVRTKWITEVHKFRSDPRTPILLVGTKIDLRDSADPKIRDKLSTGIHGHALAKEIGADKYLECSALSQKNVTNVFEEVARAVLWPKLKEKPSHCLCVLI
jgi:GTPase SAR1 family protein